MPVSSHAVISSSSMGREASEMSVSSAQNALEATAGAGLGHRTSMLGFSSFRSSAAALLIG